MSEVRASMRWAVLLSILVLAAGAVPAMGTPAEMNKKPASEKPFMHVGGGIGAPHERAGIQVPKPEDSNFYNFSCFLHRK
jgi:hypothetical protein